MSFDGIIDLIFDDSTNNYHDDVWERVVFCFWILYFCIYLFNPILSLDTILVKKNRLININS